MLSCRPWWPWARMVGISVMAEGVEAPGRRERLRAMDRPHGLGFWPVAGPAAEALLHRSAAW